jgi:hypothetical protein
MIQPPGATPFDTLTEALGGLVARHCLTSVANFKVADALGDTPRTAAELAVATGTDPGALRRMLSLLAAHGVFACSQDRFTHTPASQLLRADHPHSMAGFVAAYASPRVAELLGYFDYTLQTGNPTPLQGEPGRALRPPAGRSGARPAVQRRNGLQGTPADRQHHRRLRLLRP